MSKNMKEILRFMTKCFMNNIHDKNISEVKSVNAYKDYCAKHAFGFESPHYSFCKIVNSMHIFLLLFSNL